MKQQEITEGNKLIAEFMGAKYKPVKEGYSQASHVSIEKKFDTYDLCKTYCDEINKKQLKYNNEQYLPLPDVFGLMWEYHTSWDWLMPVVEKIEGKEIDLAVSVLIKNNACRIYRWKGSTYEQAISELHNMDSKIKSTWLAVVEFIKWHNQNTPPLTHEF